MMNTSVIELFVLRRSINSIDMAITQLLMLRAGFSSRAQAVKALAGLPTVDLLREAEIKDTYDKYAPGTEDIATSILKWCREQNEQALLQNPDHSRN